MKIIPTQTAYFVLDLSWKAVLLWGIWNYGLIRYFHKIPHLDFLLCFIIITGLWALRTVTRFATKIAIASTLVASGIFFFTRGSIFSIIQNLIEK